MISGFWGCYQFILGENVQRKDLVCYIMCCLTIIHYIWTKSLWNKYEVIGEKDYALSGMCFWMEAKWVKCLQK